MMPPPPPPITERLRVCSCICVYERPWWPVPVGIGRRGWENPVQRAFIGRGTFKFRFFGLGFNCSDNTGIVLHVGCSEKLFIQ
jgi:hypothetical protein